MCRDSDALQLLIKLYIERTHALWKVPEVFVFSLVFVLKERMFNVFKSVDVFLRRLYFSFERRTMFNVYINNYVDVFLNKVLEWLGSNALDVIRRANEKDPLIQECDIK